ncbi:esterase [Polymorphobacter arshaanensis]|uniref:Esterase n=1 Tax=Glacieibacterium arshaanense TaxID=2511025 RepID=A0A4Y9EQG4_9SPHN|nr:alpha/beta hydrolase-fold protein [Polymorphobacter arshaanensis]TFU05836.1 esterase [Polymorphobacter arshaanensis]
MHFEDVAIPSNHVPGPIPATIAYPPGYDTNRAEPYPLLIQLHGGGQSNVWLRDVAPYLETAMARGQIPPMVSVMPSAGRSFYMNFRDGSANWEDFLLNELLPWMHSNTHIATDRTGTFVSGISMGGMGALRLAFKHPDRFAAVAVLEAAIEPALAFHDIKQRDRYWRSDALFEEIYGKPVDTDWWAANNPATIAATEPGRLTGLEIYFEAGDHDLFFLHHGAEFLHRILYDAGVAHEYRLVRGADHLGPSLEPRFIDAFGFLGRVASPPDWANAEVAMVRQMMDSVKLQAGYPANPVDPARPRQR